jgi:hypothetical protein
MPRKSAIQAEALRLAQATIARTEAVLARATPPDPVQWAKTALAFDLDDWQREIMRSEHHRLIVVAARQSGKSVITGAKSAFAAQTQPGLRVIVIAPTFRQAGLLADKIEDALGRQSVGVARIRESLTLPNGSSVRVLPGDRAATIRGYTADLLVIDELGFVKPELAAAVLPMLQASRGKLVAISSPNGPTGLLYDLSRSADVQLIRVPACQVSHFDPDVIAEIRGRLGEQMARQELDAEFVASATSVFDADAMAAMFGEPPMGGLTPDMAALNREETDLENYFRLQQRNERKRGGTHWMDL